MRMSQFFRPRPYPSCYREGPVSRNPSRVSQDGSHGTFDPFPRSTFLNSGTSYESGGIPDGRAVSPDGAGVYEAYNIDVF
jgi:hypothetical protein